MATKLCVQAMEKPGHLGFHRAGRFWPSGSPIEVELLDGDDDDPKDSTKIGRKTLAALRGDQRLRIFPAGGIDEVAKLKARITELEAENAALKAAAEKAAGGGEGAKKK